MGARPRSREMDATQWTAVLEALDEVESRMPEGDPYCQDFAPMLTELRSLAVDAREHAARAAAGAADVAEANRILARVPVSPSRSPEER